MPDSDSVPVHSVSNRILSDGDRALLDLVGDGVLILNRDATIISLNPAARRLLACSDADDVVGLPVWKLLPEVGPLADLVGQALAGQTTAPLVVSLSPDILLEARVKAVGEVLLLDLRDVSAVNRAEAALQESKARFQQITENIREIFWLSDATTKEVIYVSPAYATLFGVTLESVYANSLTFLSAVHPDDSERVRNLLVDRDNPQRGLEYRIVRPDGTVRWVATESFRVRDEAGMIVRAGGIGEDITERKQLEAERTKRLDQLQDLADAALRINSASGVQDALNVVVEEVRTIIGAHQAVASLTSQEHLQDIYAVSLSEKYAAWVNYHTPPNNSGIYMLVPEQKRSLRMTQAELEAHPRWRNFSGDANRHPPMRGWLAAPLTGQDGEVIGLLQLSDRYEGDFSAEDEAVLRQLAQLASISLTKAQLFEAERRARSIADTMQSANAAITQSLELQPILELLLDYLGRLVPYDGANVMLLEADGAFHVRASKGYDGWGFVGVLDWVLDPRIHPLLRRMSDTRQPIHLDDTRLEPDWYSHPDTPQLLSWIGIPLIAEDEIIGLYSLDSERLAAFNDEHLAIARALAAPAAFAIQKALLFDQVQRYAAELEQRVEERTRELVDANQRLEALNQAKAKFVSDVSHELRNPIASLSLSFELMKRRTPQQVIDRLPDMKEPIDLLLKLTNSILDISRLDLARGKPVTFVAVDLGDVVARVVEAYRPGAEAAGLSLVLSVESDLPPVFGEPSQLTQVATNLISNAIKYTASGHVDVGARLDDQTHQLAFIVEDTGPGIDDEDMPHLFERFYRGSKVRQSTIPGTGLGLPIVHDIVQLHGGSLTVESTPGTGSRFTVLLPLA